jgi:hypothetical protein
VWLITVTVLSHSLFIVTIKFPAKACRLGVGRLFSSSLTLMHVGIGVGATQQISFDHYQSLDLSRSGQSGLERPVTVFSSHRCPTPHALHLLRFFMLWPLALTYAHGQFKVA